MNPFTIPPSSPPPPHPGMETKYYVHHFNYKIDNIEDNVEAYKQKYYEIVGIVPDHCELKNNNKLLYVKLQTKKENIHNIKILNDLSKYGITLKLSHVQMDQNSIFCLGIPAELAKKTKQTLIKSIEDLNKELKVMDIYMLPLKSEEQTLTSIKISLATQDMVDKTLSNGLTLCYHSINVTHISRAKVLGTPQCFNCFSFDHDTGSCNNNKKCLHCTEHHLYKNCPNKSKAPTCANCSGKHKSNSNKCNIRKKFLVVPISKKDPEYVIIKNPESNYHDNTPTSNPWFSKNKPSINKTQDNSNNMTVLQHPNKKPVPRPAPFSVSNQPASQQTQTTSYSDVLNIALKFNNWTFAFSELQKAFGLPVVNIPNSILNDLKPEFSGTSSIPPPELPTPAKELSFSNPTTPEVNKSYEQVDSDKDPLYSEVPSTSFSTIVTKPRPKVSTKRVSQRIEKINKNYKDQKILNKIYEELESSS